MTRQELKKLIRECVKESFEFGNSRKFKYNNWIWIPFLELNELDKKIALTSSELSKNTAENFEFEFDTKKQVLTGRYHKNIPKQRKGMNKYVLPGDLKDLYHKSYTSTANQYPNVRGANNHQPKNYV